MLVLLLEPELKRQCVLHPCLHSALAVWARGCCPYFHVRARDRTAGAETRAEKLHHPGNRLIYPELAASKGDGSRNWGGSRGIVPFFFSHGLSVFPSSPIPQISLISGGVLLKKCLHLVKPDQSTPCSLMLLNFFSLSRSISLCSLTVCLPSLNFCSDDFFFL